RLWLRLVLVRPGAAQARRALSRLSGTPGDTTAGDGSAAPAQRHSGEQLAHDPVGDERRNVGGADSRRDDLHDLGAYELESLGERPAGPEQVSARHPARLRRPGPGR